MEKVVINLATTNAWYQQGQERLKKSLDETGYDGRYLFFVGENSIPAPAHMERPYGFKPYAFLKAKELGYKYALWCDCSVWAVKNTDLIFDLIKQRGSFMLKIGEVADRWTNQNALNYFSLIKEDLKGHPLFMAGLFGLDLTNEKSLEFLNLWKQACDDGAFNGSWADHRHDLTCGSIIAKRLGMEFMTDIYSSYIGTCYGKPKKTAVFYLQGM